MASEHDRAVKALAKKYKRQSNTKGVYADHVSSFPNPTIRVGAGNHIPDLYIKFTNSREKLVEALEQLSDVGTVLPTPMRANRRDERSGLFVAHMPISSVIHDEPRHRDDPRPLQHGVNQREVRPPNSSVRNPSTSSAFARTMPSVSPSSRPNVGRESGVSSRS